MLLCGSADLVSGSHQAHRPQALPWVFDQHHAQKNDLNPWSHTQGVIPPQANAELVCAMEEVLAVYTRPDDSRRPQVCVDETSTPLVAETRLPLPAAPGQPKRVDDEYKRQGTAHLFMVFEPLAGQRRVKVTERRTGVDFAQLIREVVDEPYPQAEKIVLVMDNLNSHKPASLYEAFPPTEARRLLERVEMHHTPKHGSWLDRAETELSVLARPCLDRRITDATTLTQASAAWERHRHEATCRVDWRFTTEDARIQLKRLYPSIQLG
ncbi:MAG TPA: IS630 family transposase [Candidatus Tectomicrobia bacterium]